MTSVLLALALAASSFIDLERLGIGAYAAKDYATYLQAMTEAAKLAPNVPRIMYNLASAEALNGKKAEALATLRQMAATGVAFAVDKDDDFASLRDAPEFEAILKALADNRVPRGHADISVTLRERDLLTEGVAYDAIGKTTYVASVRKRKVIAIGADGKQRDFIRAGQDGVGGISALVLDAKRKWLWVTSHLAPVVEGYKTDDKDIAGVFAFALGDGRLVKKLLIPRDGKAHALGDLLHLADDSWLVSDSLTPVIWRIDDRGERIEEWLRGAFRSAQGMVQSADGGSVLVADYAQGLFKVSLRDKQVRLLDLAPNVVTTGIDGLYVYRDKLIATQNGTDPQRVVELSLDATQTRVAGLRVLLSGDLRFDDLSLGCIAGETLLVNAKAGWAAWGEDGKPKRTTPAPAHVLISVPLGTGDAKAGQR